MGEIGARLADVLVVTDDNPRTEDPAAIRAAVLEGDASVSTGAEVLEIGDRREAIRRVVAMARTGDTVMIAGQGPRDRPGDPGHRASLRRPRRGPRRPRGHGSRP